MVNCGSPARVCESVTNLLGLFQLPSWLEGGGGLCKNRILKFPKQERLGNLRNMYGYDGVSKTDRVARETRRQQ
jgi:hypothetical protein